MKNKYSREQKMRMSKKQTRINTENKFGQRHREKTNMQKKPTN